MPNLHKLLGFYNDHINNMIYDLCNITDITL